MVEINWSEYARCYDALLQLTPYVQLQNEMCAAVAPEAQQHILELGCGTGNLTHLLAASCPDATLHVVDASSEMLKRSREKNKAYSHIEYVLHDLDQPLRQFADVSCDVVVSVNVLYALEQPRESLQDWVRILRPGGRLIVSVPKAGNENGLILKAHAQSDKPDAYWSDFHASVEREAQLLQEAIDDADVIEQLQLVARCNRIINQVASYVYFNMEELATLVSDCGLLVHTRRYSYAEQNVTVIATKEE